MDPNIVIMHLENVDDPEYFGIPNSYQGNDSCWNNPVSLSEWWIAQDIAFQDKSGLSISLFIYSRFNVQKLK